MSQALVWCSVVFLSTPSARRATAGARGYAACGRISIHALREEGDTVQNVPGDKLSAISIHALREEGDAETKHLQELSGAFLSTPSARRATQNGQHRGQPARNFYPRPPRGGRLAAAVASLRMVTVFLSTPSARRATRGPGTPHRPLGYFYPRPPRGGRPVVKMHKILRLEKISIHALREEGDSIQRPAKETGHNFYPRPPRGGRPTLSAQIVQKSYFYPRPPRGGRLPVRR